MNDALLGPAAALALSLLFNGLFYGGKIMPRNTIPREDYKALQDVNVSQAKAAEAVTTALTEQTTAMKELVTAVRTIQRNGGVA